MGFKPPRAGIYFISNDLQKFSTSHILGFWQFSAYFWLSTDRCHIRNNLVDRRLRLADPPPQFLCLCGEVADTRVDLISTFFLNPNEALAL